MLRGLRFNVASQKLEETPSDVAGTGNDVNDNDKPYDSSMEAGYDVASTATDSKGAKKKKGSRKTKKSERREREEKHDEMEEEQATDSDEDLTGKTARKLATQMSEKGHSSCYMLIYFS